MQDKENLDSLKKAVGTVEEAVSGKINPEKSVKKTEEQIDPNEGDAKMPGQRGSNYTPPKRTKAYFKNKKKKRMQKASRRNNRKKK